jgi:hypothetical protein
MWRLAMVMAFAIEEHGELGARQLTRIRAPRHTLEKTLLANLS